VANDPQAAHTVVEAIEARPFELPKTMWDDAAPRSQGGRKARTAADAQAVGQEVPAAKVIPTAVSPPKREVRRGRCAVPGFDARRAERQAKAMAMKKAGATH
jgi:hypothetical protein